ncbi:hypothetical protein NHX12_031087 [Muraenolepis orangiensis]|uniref:UBA domain-containing protein n=1 Tax=Muraenolepis orangiensis TaxID=630683 RepID=A0A9Q0E9Y5_9TELE|nr:hypothetical protein NHX12_031087 [Muraenolepis orangiensis]
MMSVLGSDKARGPREKTLPTVTHSSQPQKQIQATADQMRLAQMIYDKNDSDFECKVNQLVEVTGKNQDECMIALHDCNEDVNRAINFLLESPSDTPVGTTSWETVGKKKPLVKEGPSESKENKENREKKDKEGNKGRSASSRRGKARSRQARPEENGVGVTSVDRGSEGGRRGRGGRVAGGRGRGRAPPGSRFSAQGMGTFNPADYTSEARMRAAHTEGWDTGTNGNNPDGTAWRNTLEDWAAEDWSEDVSLSETKVFTSSCAPAAENHLKPGQSLDLASLLQNTSYAHVALSSVLGAGFGDLGQSKRSQPSAGAQILEQLKGPGLGPLPSSQARPPVSTQGVGRLPGLGVTVPPAVSSSWELKGPEPGTSSLSSQFSREFGLQPEPSLVLSHLVQRHAGPSLPLARQPSPPTQRLQQAGPAAPSPGLLQAASVGQGGPMMAAGTAKSPAPSAGLEPPGSNTPQQQRGPLKGQKRRIPPTSKIPSTAVEMPGSTDIPGLNLQFGALDFGSEAAVPDFGGVDNRAVGAPRDSTPAPPTAITATAAPLPPPGPQNQSSLYSTPLSESLGSPLSLPLPISSSEPVYHSPPVTLPSLPPPSLEQRSFRAGHEWSPQHEDLCCVRHVNSGPSGPSHLPSVLPNHSAVMASLAQDMPSVSQLSSLNSHASSPCSVSAGVSGALNYSGVDSGGAGSLAPSSGKAPPNLSQAVPPLLPNQYIMGPGGLLPAYPQIYGYEDLHMLQSRLPMPSLQDYYGMTFPGPTALSGRDGSLANNPYSGEVTKFGRNDSTSPAPPTSLYTGLPYYPGVPSAVPGAAAFQYGPTMFVPPGAPGLASGKQHGLSLGLGNPSAGPFQQQSQQQASGYGQHTFSSGYEELTAGPAGMDYSKGYNNSSQTQAKSAASGPGKGVSVTSSNSGVPDISGSVYNKSQAFDKQGFHAGTPPPFSLPSALGGPGPLNPGGAPGGYAPAPFLHILPHQQPHSQLLHHHLAQDGQGGPSQRGQSSSMQQKSQVNKSSYGSSPYWAN